jgi:signal transduction histidine kinase
VLKELFSTKSKVNWAAVTVLLTLFIGFFDYISGTAISLSAFYLVPVSLATWAVNVRFALFISVLGVAVWASGNVISGDDEFATPFLICWNVTVQLASYLVVVFTLNRLLHLQHQLEARVSERAAALTKEVTERERLQRELLNVSEREQRRIGQDLHDGLCQHLAGTALAGQVLREKLARRQLGEAADAQKVVELIEEGVLLSRQSAKGLHPVEMDAEGLMLALEEFAATTGKLFRIECRFECESPVLIHDTASAGHMYRIAQEAVRNAITHGHAQNILIQLNTLDDGLELRIEDNGLGLSETTIPREGMGLRIMGHRARVIGGTFGVAPREGGGTVVTCTLPLVSGMEDFIGEQASL